MALSKGSSYHYSIDHSRLTASGYQCGKASHVSLTLLLVDGSLPSFLVSPQPLSPGFGRQLSPPVGPGLVRSACMDGTQGGYPRAKLSRRHVLSLKPLRQGRAGTRHLEMEPGSAGWAAGGWGQEWSRGRRTLKGVMRGGSAHIRCCGSPVWPRPCAAATMTLPEPSVSLGPQKAPPRWASCPCVGQNDILPCKPHPHRPS